MTKQRRQRLSMNEKIISNQDIKFSELRVIGADNEMLGIISRDTALNLAKNSGLDLVIVTEQSNPPVAKITDANKHMYDIKKRIKEQQKKARQQSVDIKEIKLRPQIGQHDLGIKMKQVQKFINKNAKVKITIQLRGREIERGREAIDSLSVQIKNRLENFKFDQPLKQAGNRITGVIIKDG